VAEPLSFCMVTTFYPPHHFGGDAMHAYRLSNALARRGHRVTVVHSEDAYRALGGREREDSFPHEPGVPLWPLRTAFPVAAATATYVSGRPTLYGAQLDAVFRGQPFDVVHFHNVSLAGGPGVLRRGQGVKLYTTSEHWLVCPMHVLFRYGREPCVEPHCLRCTLAFRRPPQLWRYTGLLDRAVADVDLFLAPSRFTLEAHQARGFSRPMRVLPHFLADADVSTTVSSGPGPGQPGDRPGSVRGQVGVRPGSDPGLLRARLSERPYVLFVGRLERLKGVHVLVEAFRKYRELDLVVAGDGEEQGPLERQAAGLEHVRFLGHVPQGELDALYRGATALVVPSVGYEVFGLVVLEAFARKTPAIVHDLGALPELVADSDGGLVYRTPDELVAAVERLRTDTTLRNDFGAKGHDAWRRLWSEERHLTAYFEAIDEARETREARGSRQ
jgi:glycosyltransferase involved in cell wall biosynthesis